MISLSIKPLGVWFKQGGSLESGSPLDRAFLIALIILSLWMLKKRNFDLIHAIKKNQGLVILIAFMLLSILWSTIPFISFKRWARELLALLMAFCVITEPSPRKTIESILRRTTYILIPFSLLLVKYFPEYGVNFGQWSGERMWIGVADQKNGLCLLCVISALFLIWTLVRRLQGNSPSVWRYQTHSEIAVLAITIWLMGGPQRSLSYSVTSNAAMVLGLIIYFGFHLLKKAERIINVNTLIIILSLIILLGLLMPFTGGAIVSPYSATVGRDATMTGRTQVWATLLPVAMKKLLAGHGFGGFWTTQARKVFLIPNAHSGYLDLILELGFIGILLVSIFLISSCKKAHGELSRNFDWGTLNIIFIMGLALHNSAESSINSFNTPLTAVVLFFSVASATIIE